MNIVLTPQNIFDSYLKELDKKIKETVHSPEQALIMVEVLMVKVKELFTQKGYTEDDALLFMEHTLQELDETKPTIH
jgi:hypothetical protein|tara:strand:- start:169 stop:399 length:231 start_codon:yes stop_codon:yes gene_type:complete